MDIKLQTGEKIVKKGFANHFKENVAAGGMLFLTNKRIVFKTHKMNMGVYELPIPLNQIASLRKSNTLFIVPNGLSIELKNGKTEKFVLWGRSGWISKIEGLIR